MPITLEQLKNLKHGDILYHVIEQNADDTPQRWKVNGKVKRWKHHEDRAQVPIKRGLRQYDYVCNHDLYWWCLDEAEAMSFHDPKLNKNPLNG